ncbi:MAG: transcription regulator [Haloplasmataceae bacterium]|nr:transcription regulator [Haloplasmataceae bacterium]
MNLGYLLSKATRLCKQDLNLRLSELDLTVAQYIILRDIFMYESQPELEKHVNPACIAARLNCDRPTVTGIIQRLLDHGWILKKDNLHDKRSFYLELTNKTREILPKLDELDEMTLSKAVSSLEEHEVDQLKKFLRQIIKNLHKGEEHE